MADKVSAAITYLDSNQNKGSKSITDINPEADNGAIKNFCVGLVGLTTNTISQIDRVEKTDITHATPTPAKPKLELTIDNTALARVAASESGTNEVIAQLPTGMATDDNAPKVATVIIMTTEDRTIGAYDKNNITDVYTMAGYTDSFKIGVASKYYSTSESFGFAKVTFNFEETATTAATSYQLRFTDTAGAATFVQL